MKVNRYWGGVFFVLFSVIFIQRVDAEVREFSLPDGRSLKAEIMSYNAKLNKVELKLANGKRKKVSPSLFVEDDQKFIKEWAAVEGFRSERTFKLSCTKKLEEKWKKDIKVTFTTGEEDAVGETKFEKFGYKLLLENRNEFALEGITVEYCIFCKEVGKGDWREQADWFEKQHKDSMEIKNLPARSKKEFKTSTVVIARQELTGVYYLNSGAPEKIGVKLEGIWVRIHIKTPGGQTAVRSIFEPSGLEGKYAWPK